MSKSNFKITIHMVQSLDGMIAKKDNSVSWFETTDNFENGVEFGQEDMTAFLKSVDCYIMGSNTYQHAVELSAAYGWPYGEVPTIVLSHKSLPAQHANVEIYSGDLTRLVEDKLKPNYNNVWVVGGAAAARAFLRLKLADEIRIPVLPIILGNGKPFFENLEFEQALHLKEVVAYKNGMVDLHYEIKK